MAIENLQAEHPESQVPVLVSDDASKLVLRQLVQRFYGVDPAVDAKLDAHAAEIFDTPTLKKIPVLPQIGPRVGLYFEGEPGVGKTSCIKSGSLQFCEYAGLNFIENPEPGYKFDVQKDFLQVLVNLSGKTNTSDAGGMPFRKELETDVVMDHRRKAAGSLMWLSAELASRLQGASILARFAVENGAEYEQGSQTIKDLRIKSDPATAMEVVEHIIGHLTEEAKESGIIPTILTDNSPAPEHTTSIRVLQMDDGVDISVCGPTPSKDMAREYVAAVLPNERMAMLSKAKFGLLNFDDVANGSEAVRNVCLEIVQIGRLSGVADAGRAVVTMTGNMGALDNTNTMSERSDAETTRMLTIRVVDTPKDWARRMQAKYSHLNDGNGLPITGFMPEFIEKYGDQDHIFSAGYGDNRIERGIPKPNSRSLENAMWSIAPYFKIANEAGIDISHFDSEVRISLLGTVGATFEKLYSGFLASVSNDARPLAQELVKNGELSPQSAAKFESKMGSGLRATEVDFGFTFAICLCDEALTKVAEQAKQAANNGTSYENAQDLRDATRLAFDRVFTGLDLLDRNSEATFAISRITDGLRDIADRFGVEGMKVSKNANASLSSALCMDASDVMRQSSVLQNPNLIRSSSHDDGDIRKIFADITTNTIGLSRSRAATP